ncbi:outer membrane protein assembly factor BamB [Polynucleobacter sp. IMCC30063]|uniref:outer membrane protein assembly factor BamB n=1 Tax=unclassified Polynucleobacter TaxID=2640945 RepID=UPI001F2EB9FF|nr:MULTISPECIES: outer membrane protein assembly factor BamB [unclassified Polynucleobacter]MCE7505962.1 outer membrane protein assembly factor BamB [Polynucleobacter sp. IMCC30063]MCE7527150.1 outer membrane protein assembly factor BamB [Polynucleobacter sp. IMCC 30228]MCE7528993.1 outer membrane protein assembly factor BamB [Polynucleobacter sp. IMCC 29146]
MRRALFALLALLVCSMLACSGSSRTRKPNDLTAVTNQFEMKEIWAANVGSSEPYYFDPMVAGNSVYAASASGKLVRLDLQTGKTIWEVSVPDRLAVGPGSDGKTTVAVSAKGMVYAFDEAGKNMWSVSVGSEVLTEPIVAAGTVVIRTLDNRFMGLDVLTGKRRWFYQRQQSVLSLRVGYGMLLVNNEVIVTGLSSGRFGMIGVNNGALIWETSVSFPKGFSEIERLNDVSAKPSLEGDKLCAVSYQGKIGCSMVRTGNLIWSKDFSSYTGTAQGPELVFASNEKSQVAAFKSADGTQVWETSKLNWRDLGEPTAIGRVLLFGDAEGYLHAISQANGEIVARIRHDTSPIASAPVVAGGLVLVQSQGGKLVAYQPK